MRVFVPDNIILYIHKGHSYAKKISREFPIDASYSSNEHTHRRALVATDLETYVPTNFTTEIDHFTTTRAFSRLK